MNLIVGLGNPGRSYQAHRHNVGFKVVDVLADRCGTEVKKRSFGAFVEKTSLGGEQVLLAKPQTFMNLSGDTVSPLLGYYKLDFEDLIVIHDDIDLELGQLKLAKDAGHGGHNGVRSIVEALGSNDFYRVRMGVGRPPEKMDPADYVLQKFADSELDVVKKMIDDAADAVIVLMKEGLKEAQSRYH